MTVFSQSLNDESSIIEQFFSDNMNAAWSEIDRWESILQSFLQVLFDAWRCPIKNVFQSNICLYSLYFVHLSSLRLLIYEFSRRFRSFIVFTTVHKISTRKELNDPEKALCIKCKRFSHKDAYFCCEKL
jgi:hypothetical protein